MVLKYNRQEEVGLEKLLIALILIFAFFLSVYGIEWGLPNKHHIFSYYPDEYNAIAILRGLNLSTFDLNPHYFINPSFHYYLIGIILKIASFFKILILTNSSNFYHFHPEEFAKIYLIGRAVTVFFAIMTIYLTYLIGKNYYNKNVGLLAAFFLSLMPLFIIQSHLMELSILTLFWITLSMLFAFKILHACKLKYYILAGISVGLGIATKYTVVPFILVVILAHLLGNKRSSKIKDFFVSIINRKLFLFIFIVIIVFFITNPYALLSFNEFKQGLTLALKQMGQRWQCFGLGWFHPVTNLLKYGMGFPILILSLAGIVLALFRRRKVDLLILFWIFLYYFFTAKSKSTIARYQTGYLPFLSLMGAGIFFPILSNFKKTQLRIVRTLSIFIIVFVVIYTFLNTISYLKLLRNKDIREKASIWIEANIPYNSTIAVVTEPYWFSPDIIFKEYFYNGRSEVYKNPKPKYSIINLEYDVNSLGTYKPTYIILSDFELINASDTAMEFFDTLINNNRYEEIKRFEKIPSFLGLKFSEPFFKKNWTYKYNSLLSLLKSYPPTDFKIFSPTIMIFKRK